MIPSLGEQTLHALRFLSSVDLFSEAEYTEYPTQNLFLLLNLFGIMLSKIDPTSTISWKKLKEHQIELQGQHLRNWFLDNPLRFEKFSISLNDQFLFDFSKNLIQSDTLVLLENLFEECGVHHGITSMFSGEAINETENRAVLHTALRNFSNRPVLVGGKDVMPEVRKVLDKMAAFSSELINGGWKGHSEKVITDVVNIGIGGSDLGPAMVYDALRPFQAPHINCHFVSNVDGADIMETLGRLNPETTLFIIASKTFTTQETMANAHTARSWFLESEASADDITKHFVAVSTNAEGVKNFGIDPNNMFVFWDWVGGRYSVWSAIGLSLCCGLGFSNFELLLKGAHSVDEHFASQPFHKNIPLLMAAIGIWYTNFWDASSEAIIPYNQNMHRFASYFQQGNMESNGKSVDRNSKKVSYPTGPIVWGQPGTNGQHAFFQLIHQGTHLIPCDFIGFANSNYEAGDQHSLLLSNFLAQTQALMRGKSEEEATAELKEDFSHLASYKVFEGNKPTTTILGKQLTPETLGMLMACYEHKIFAQGLVWNIFSFDQWGVELGKQLAKTIIPKLKNANTSEERLDSSTEGLIAKISEWK